MSFNCKCHQMSNVLATFLNLWHFLGHFLSYFSYLIFVLFSPQTKFLAQFFSTSMRVNRDKTDFATKQSNSHKRDILQQNSIKCDKTSKIVTDFLHLSHVEKYLHMTDFLHLSHVEKFSTWQICLHISHVEKFLHVTEFPHIYHVEKHVMGRISPHDQFFLHRRLLWRLWQISGMYCMCI